MAHFDCVVDTNELARSVSNVNKHIDATTGAVITMKAAVVAAEKEGADHVCENVNRGFFALMYSQISQKMAALQSEIDAKLLKLNYQRRQLNAIQTRMGRDYQMICARYGNIFTSLNRALKQRVVDLDRPIINLVETDASKITNRQNLMMSNVPLNQEESIKLSQRITTSNLKNKALEAISAISRFIADSQRLERVTNNILLRKRIQTAKENVMVPVAVIQSNFDDSGSSVTQTYVSQLGLSEEARSFISNSVASAIRNDELHWHEDTDKEELTNQFRLMVAESHLDKRRKDMILRMFERSNYETL